MVMLMWASVMFESICTRTVSSKSTHHVVCIGQGLSKLHKKCEKSLLHKLVTRYMDGHLWLCSRGHNSVMLESVCAKYTFTKLTINFTNDTIEMSLQWRVQDLTLRGAWLWRGRKSLKVLT